MTRHLTGACLVLLGATWAREAKASAVLPATAPVVSSVTVPADVSLLVAVEPGVDAEVSAPDVRSAIAAELHRPVVAPGDALAREAAQVLVVAVDATRIRMSLRDGPHGVVSREIPAPAHNRLQAIAWLAGNVARDQLGGTELAPPVAARAEPTPVAPPSFESSPTPAATVAQGAERVPAIRSPWSFTVAAGPTAVPFEGGNLLETTTHRGQMFALEAQLERSARDFLGLAAELGEVEGQVRHVLSVAAFMGARKPFRRWALEAALGGGIEAVRLRETSYSLITHSGDGSRDLQQSSSLDTVPSLFVRLTGQAVVPLSATVDAVVGVNLHGTIHSLSDNFAALTLGARLHLP